MILCLSIMITERLCSAVFCEIVHIPQENVLTQLLAIPDSARMVLGRQSLHLSCSKYINALVILKGIYMKKADKNKEQLSQTNIIVNDKKAETKEQLLYDSMQLKLISRQLMIWCKSQASDDFWGKNVIWGGTQEWLLVCGYWFIFWAKYWL